MYSHYVFALSVLFLTILVVINLNVITLQNNTVDTVYIRESSKEFNFFDEFYTLECLRIRKAPEGSTNKLLCKCCAFYFNI